MNILISASIVLSFAFSMMPFASLEAEGFLAAFYCSVLPVMMLAALRMPPGIVQLPRTPLVPVAMAFWVLALVSASLSEIRDISFIYFCFFSVFPLTAIGAWFLMRDLKVMKITGLALAGIFFALALVSLAQYFFWPETLPFYGRVQWPLANPNSLAAVYMLGLFGALGGMLGSQSRLHSNLFLTLAVLIVAAIIATGSRGAMISIAAGLGVLLFAVPVFAARHRRCMGIMALAAGGIFAAFHFLRAEQHYALVDTIMRTLASDPAMPALFERPEIWKSALQIFMQHFRTGTGIGTFFLYYPEVRGADYTSAGLMVHNDALQFAVEMGVLAPALFLVFVAGALLRTRRALRSCAGDDPRRVVIGVSAAALAALVINAQVTYIFYVLPVLVLAGVLLGVWFYATASVLAERPVLLNIENPVLAGAVKVLVLVQVALMIYGLTVFQGGYILTQRAQDQLQAGNMLAFADDVNHAGRLTGGRNYQAYILAAAVPMGILEARGNAMEAGEAGKLHGQALSLLGKAQSLNPRAAVVDYYRALLERIVPGGNRQKARAFLGRSLALDPLHMQARMLLTDILIEDGDEEGAFRTLHEGLKWSGVIPDAFPLLMRLRSMAERRGDQDIVADIDRRITELGKRNKVAGGPGFANLHARGPTHQMLIDSLQNALQGAAQP